MNSPCGECLKYISKFYCCCQQIYLCEYCKDSHLNTNHHFLLDENVDISRPYGFQPTIKSRLKEHILKLKQKISEEHESHQTLIISGQALISSPGLPFARYQVNCKPELLSLLNKLSTIEVCLMDKHNKLCKVSFPDNQLLRPKTEVDLDIRGFYLLEWENKQVVVGGNRNFQANNIIFVISEDSSVTQLASMQSGLNSYFPLINNSILYIIGGRNINNLVKVSLDTISCYDLRTGKELQKLSMTKKRHRVVACMHKEKLWVTSINESTMEIIDITNQVSESLETNLKITEDSVFASNNKDLILFTDCKIYVLGNRNQFKLTLDLSDFQEVLKNESWNLGHFPVFTGDLVIFFGSHKAIFYSTSSNSVEIKDINFND